MEGHRFEDLSEEPGEADAEILRDAVAPDLSFLSLEKVAFKGLRRLFKRRAMVAELLRKVRGVSQSKAWALEASRAKHIASRGALKNGSHGHSMTF